MNELKPCDARDMWNAVTELEDMALHPSIKKRLSAETLAIAIAAISEKAGQNRRPAPENKPLTLEQLREMDGEPVWVCGMPGHEIKWTPGWRIIDGNRVAYRRWNDTVMYLYFADYGRTWLAYARKPEQEKR